MRQNRGFSALRSNGIRPAPKRVQSIIHGIGAPDGNGDLPGEEKIDKIMALAEKVMHRFFDFVKELKRDLETDQL